MSTFTAVAVAAALFLGLPLVLIAAGLAGPVGWIAAAVILPLAVLAVILWLGWFRRSPDDGPAA